MAGYVPDSKRDDYETPQWLFEELNDIFYFNIDVAASNDNKKCESWFSKDDNALKQSWIPCHPSINGSDKGRCWCNPPYGRKSGIWFTKAVEEVYLHKNADLVCMLVNSSTELTIWHKRVWNIAPYILFFDKRIKYELNGQPIENSSTKGSALVIYTRKIIKDINKLDKFGFIDRLYRSRGK